MQVSGALKNLRAAPMLENLQIHEEKLSDQDFKDISKLGTLTSLAIDWDAVSDKQYLTLVNALPNLVDTAVSVRTCPDLPPNVIAEAESIMREHAKALKGVADM